MNGGKKMYKLLGADGKQYLSETPGALGGNSQLKIYGRLNCSSALRAIRDFPGSHEKIRVFFASEEAAQAAGYRPCGKCMKAQHDRWKAGELDIPNKYKPKV